MSETLHARYELLDDRWPGILQRLESDGYRIQPSSDEPGKETLFEIRQCGDEKTALWFVVHGTDDGQYRVIDVHWLANTLDHNPGWMALLALRIEDELIRCGARCAFGSVASDSKVKKLAADSKDS